MLRHRPLTRFLVQVLLLYALLMVPWPGVAAAYGFLYRGAAIILFSTIGARGEVDFRPREHGTGGHDTTVTLVNRREDYLTRQSMTISTRYHGYAPTALLVALALATPIPWPRRRRLLLWGFLFVQVYVVIRLVLIFIWIGVLLGRGDWRSMRALFTNPPA